MSTDELASIVINALRDEARHQWDLSRLNIGDTHDLIGNALDNVADKIDSLIGEARK